MRDGLRVLGFAVVLLGALTLFSLYMAQSSGSWGPSLGDWAQSHDVRRIMWGASGVIYAVSGLLLIMLRRWSSILFVVAAVLAAACMTFDMASFAQAEMSGFGARRIRADIVSLVCALLLTGLTFPMARRRILR